MVTLIKSQSEFESLKELLGKSRNRKPIIIPFWCDDEKHPYETSLSLICISFSLKQTHLIPIQHSEAEFLVTDLSFLSGESFFVFNKKKLLQTLNLKGLSANLTSLKLLNWFRENKKLKIQKLPTYFQTFPQSGHKVKTNHIPIYQICKSINSFLKEFNSLIENTSSIRGLSSFKKYDENVIPVFSEIESNGLSIHEDSFHNVFEDKISREFRDKVYTDYDLFTSTGRPSNSAYNINFAALDPSKNQKDPVISRFDDGVLVQFDYDAFHLRLIGNLINYNLPQESFHTYLGKKYFDKKSLTDEEYQDSKKITFQFLYGKDIKEARNLEYFERTFNFRDELWDKFKDKGFLITPKFERKIPEENISEVNPGKAFSYFIQSYETEFNTTVMSEILQVLNEFKTELIHYTYDALLFDFCLSDGKELISKIKRKMETQNMKVKGSVGKNFGDMRELDFKDE